jgi:hypothetical protein
VRPREGVKERVERSTEESERVTTWLKSEQAKEFLRRSPELKEVFSSAAVAAKTAPKELAAAVASEVKALDKVQAQLATFRVK